MHGIGRGRAGVVVATLALLGSVGCSATEPPDRPRVPSFASSTPAAPAAPEADRDGALADDCGLLLTPADLGAVLGLPLDSVAVRTTIGVPAPSVGRTERVACTYSGTPTGPFRGRSLLLVNAAAYVDGAAAQKQWRTNADVEGGVRTEMRLGVAPAVLFDRPDESVLMVVYESGTLTVVLPDGPRPGDRSRADMIVDLALRVLPALASTAPTSTPVADPARAAGPPP